MDHVAALAQSSPASALATPDRSATGDVPGVYSLTSDVRFRG